VYDTDWGELQLIQNGFNVSGKYDHDDGKLEGVIKGNVIYGKWFEAPSYNELDDAGLFELVFTDDFNAFTGKWKYGFAEGIMDQGTWHVKKRQ